MVKAVSVPLRLADVALGAVLLYSFFQPWLSFLGSPVAAHRIRETLQGPHRLVSAFTRDAQVSADYALSLWLWAVPAAAALVLVLGALRGAGPKARAAAGFAAGAVAVAAFLFLRVRLAGYPFQRLESGAWLALSAGIGLLLVAAVRAGMWLRAKG